MEGVKIRVDLRNVHETLLLPLWGRAEETKMRDPVLRDRKAVEMVGRLDYDFSSFRSGMKRFTILCLAIRAKEFDSLIRDFIQEHPRATIVNIGAGLDTTFYRVDNGQIRWYDLDVPEVIRLRGELLPESTGTGPVRIPKSMFDESFLDDIEPPQDGILFLAGGVLMYFEEEKVRSFLAMLSRRFPGGELVFDAIAPAGLRFSSDMVKKSGIAGAGMKWGLRGARDMERWGLGIRQLESYPLCFRTKIFSSWGLPCGLLLRLNNLLRVITINRVRFAGGVSPRPAARRGAGGNK